MRSIYLDHAATTPVRGEVREAMEPFLSDNFANPSSLHAPGRRASAALEGARRRIAEAVGALPSEICFVRGGTEGNNLAILGRAEVARAAGRTPLIALSSLEHPAVREAAGAVVEDGGESLTIRIAEDGSIDEEDLEEACRREAAVISLMWVNNEIGLVLSLEDAIRRARDSGIPIHTDAVQALGKLPLRFDELPVDLATATGHKIHGPKGIGFLFVRERVEVRPRIFGGGQERKLRPGTEDVAGAVGLAEAVTLAVAEQAGEAERLSHLRDTMEEALQRAVPDMVVHGARGRRAPHILHVGIPVLDGETLLMALDMEGVAASGGSACSSGSTRVSPVLEALYGSAAPGTGAPTAALRFSLGRETTPEDVEEAAHRTIAVVERIRAMSGV